MEALRYIGKDKNMRVNGRPLVHGAIIDDPKLVRDLADLPEFEPAEASQPAPIEIEDEEETE